MAKANVQHDAAETPPTKDVTEKWADEGIGLAAQIRRAASSLSWYRNAAKRPGISAATKKSRKTQAARYEKLLAELRARRDEAKS